MSSSPALSAEAATRFKGEPATRLPMRCALLAALLLAATLGPASLFLTQPASASPFTWSPPELVDGRGVVYQVSLAVDSQGNPHLTYYESTVDKDLRYAFRNGSAWVREDVDTVGDVGGSPSITLDSVGNPHVVSIDATRDVLRHSVREGGAWQSESVVPLIPFGGGNLRAIGSAMGVSDDLHVCYQADPPPPGSVESLMYVRKDGTSWTNESIETGPSGVGLYCSVAIDSAGRPRISYADQGSGGDLRYAAWNGTAWNLTTVDSADGAEGWTSLALNASGNPYISYKTGAAEGKIVYHDGTAWQTLVAPSNAHYSPSIAFDAQDRLHAPTWGFVGGIPGGFRHSVWDGSWANETFPQKFLDATSLALDAVGNPHLAWAVDGDLYYARAFSAPQAPTAPIPLQAAAGDGQVSLVWTAPAWDGGSPITGYRLYRGTPPTPYEQSTTPDNATTWTDTSVTNGLTYYYRVAAVTAIGEGPPSNEVTAIPSGPGDDPPACLILFPTGGTVSGVEIVQGTATDPESSLDLVEVRVDSGAWASAAGMAVWVYAWNSSTVTDGAHTIEARAFDGTEYSAICSVTVTTDNGVMPPRDGDFIRDYGWILIALFLILLVVGIGFAIARRRKPRDRTEEEPKISS